ncbi:FkbM family methyltransferase [Blastococcus sp. TBT05-19]|uniref:FkbM family methyltransferase n=1 Tax=Blastococcus sp. TBT05-19 TaxID=2250581 RepID=UPI0011BEC54C|nr:FkbM family methyltransferase [Blastococcus sp. TBT05-19]
MTAPRLSVLLTTRDGEDLVERALASIERQDLVEALEVVVVADDASGERVRQLVTAWSERTQVAARVVTGGSRPAAQEFHRGVVACSGRYVAVLDARDEWTAADKLRRQVELLDEHPHLSMAATRTSVVDDATGSAETLPAIDAPGAESHVEVSDVVGFPTPSCAVYRAELLERLDPGIFESPDHERLVDLAMARYGSVGVLTEEMTRHAARPGGDRPGSGASPHDPHTLLPEPVAPGLPQPSDPAAGTGAPRRGGMVVLDDYFPAKGTGFRIAEFDWLLRHGVVAEVLTTVEPFAPVAAEHAALYPGTQRQISRYDARRLAEFDCASIMFLNNAAMFLADLERHALPFVLQLYPGGGLYLGDPVSERKLRRVLASPLLRHVITTQPVVTALVREVGGGSVPVTEVIGGPVGRSCLAPGAGLRTDYFGSGKEFLDVCFVAARYTPDGSDKGWPVFLESLRSLADAGLPVRGHVVGGFGPADVGPEHAELDLSFSGVLSTPELHEFYLGMDVIVSPVAAGRITPGAFDGFPTGACVEASLSGVAMVATDPLGQNRLYTDGTDILMPRADADDVVARILAMVAEPDGVRRVAQAGLRTTRRTYGVDAQLSSRRRVLEAALADARARQATPPGDPLVSILVPAYNGERFLKAALQSALGQSHRNIEVIVGDDGSTDRTPEILAAAAAADDRVRVIRFDRNVGGLENPRRLLAEARGEYVKYLMHDDVLGTDCVRELVRGMQRHPEASMAFSHRVLVNEDGKPVPGHEYPKLRDKPGLIGGRELGDVVLVNCTNVIGEPTTVLFRRDDVSPADLWMVDDRTVDVLNDVQLWLFLLARGPAYYTPRTLSRFRSHGGQNSVNPRYIGRAERDWSRLVDWGARNGFLAGEHQERRAHARALFLAAARVVELASTPDYGAALEAALLSTAALVELTRPTPATRSEGLVERARSAVVRERLAQELDVWTRSYPVALAAPAIDAAEIGATVQAFRDVLAQEVAERAVVAVPADRLEQAVPLLEEALAQGPDIDLELVPTDEPSMLFPGPWLAVVPRGGTWPDGRALAIWSIDPGGDDVDRGGAGPDRLELPECREILADVQQRTGDFSEMWAALTEADFQRSGRRTGLLSRVDSTFIGDFDRRRATIPPDRPYFTGALANGVRYMGDARDWPSALHAVDPECNGVLIAALEEELSRRPGNVVDVGTNIGVVAASLAAHVGPTGRVVAFEPSPDTVRLAASTIALNDAGNVTLYNAAVSDADGSLVFNATPGNSAIASARRHAFGLLNEWEEVTVPALRLDTLHGDGELDGVSLVKIDVEGHELSVLRGALEFIAATRPTVVYEYTPVAAADHGWTQEDSIALLSKAGDFEFTALAESDGEVLPFPLPAGYAGQVNVFARPV